MHKAGATRLEAGYGNRCNDPGEVSVDGSLIEPALSGVSRYSVNGTRLMIVPNVFGLPASR